MVEYFKPNQVLILPELAGRLQLKTDKFLFVRSLMAAWVHVIELKMNKTGHML